MQGLVLAFLVLLRQPGHLGALEMRGWHNWGTARNQLPQRSVSPKRRLAFAGPRKIQGECF